MKQRGKDQFAPAERVLVAEMVAAAEAAERVVLAAERGARAAVVDGREWVDKPALAGHFSCSVRWIEQRMEDGLPHAHIAGRVKFRLSDVTRWLTDNGHIDHRGEALN